jgi:hypothetical protein
MCDVRSRRIDTKVAGTIGFLANVLMKALELSDLELRLAKLEGQCVPEKPAQQA